MSRKIQNIGTMLAAACVLPLFAQGVSGEQPVPRDVGELSIALDEIFEGGHVPGAQVVIIEDGGIVLSQTHGVADVASGTPVTEETVFRAGSISKSFVAVSVMVAAESGILDLSTPVAELVPDVEFTNAWETTHPVRLVHLLEHTAGFWDVGLPEFLGSDRHATLEEGLSLGPHQRVSRWRPGARSAYCNSGPAMVALALQRVSGQEFEEFVDRRVLDPLGMTSSTFRFTEQIERRVATSYRDDGVSPVPHTHLLMRPSGGLNTTAPELARFVLMLLNRGELDGVRVLTPESVARLERAESLVAAAEYGHDSVYGLGNAPIYGDKLVFRGHDGGIDGFSGTYAYDPRLGAGVVLLVSGGEDDAFVEALDLTLEYLARHYEPDLPPPFPRDPEELASLEGDYVAAAPRSRFTGLIEAFASPLKVAYATETGLVVGGVPRVPVSAHGFRRPERGETSFVIIEGEGGIPEIHYSGSSYLRVSRVRGLASSVFPLSLLLGLLMLLGYNISSYIRDGVRRMRGRSLPERSAGAIRLRRLALLTAGSFSVAMVLFGVKAAGPLDRLGPFASVTPLSAMLFLLTAIAPVLGVLTLVVVLFDARAGGAFRRGYHVVATLLFLGGMAWIAAFGWIPLRTWIL